MTRAGGHAWERGSRAARVAAVTTALMVGIWMGMQFWPHWLELRDHRSSAREPSPSNTTLGSPPLLPPDVRASMSGTAASISAAPQPLVLVATTPATTLSESTAALGTDRQNPQLYAGGALLSNGARIEKIAADHVVLSLAGERKALFLAAREAAPTVTVGGSPVAATSRAAEASSREDISEFIRAQAVFEDGRLQGLEVRPGSNTAAFDALGVLTGDVIRSIEGKPIESEFDWQEIEDALVSGASIVVGVERNGSRLSVSMDGARLAASPPAA